MANLRTNNLSGEQGQKAYRGSVFFAGNDTGTALRAVESDSNLTFGTGDFTIEFWILRNNSDNAVFLDWRHTSGGNQGVRITLYSDSNLKFFNGAGDQISGSSPLTTNSWHHVALARASSSTRLFVNGVQFGSTYSDSGDYVGPQDSGGIYIGRFGGGSYDFKGYFSNLRIVKGTALYTSDFTPPQSELTLVDGTSVLCCQDSDDPTQDAAGTTITAEGNLSNTDLTKQQPKVIPPYGVDAGNTFGGTIQQSSQGYMYFPTGRTEERGRGRGLFNGGGGPINTIQYIQIQSSGNSQDFGDLTSSRDLMGSAASSVRGVFGGQGSPTYSNTIDFVTISTTANAIDFGDLINPNYTPGALASDTRAVWGGGATPADSTEDQIQFATIATLGNTTDFGNLTVGRRHVGGLSSPTRGVYGAGAGPGITDVMDFITIASTGNATDFGNMTVSRNDSAGCSNAIRGLFIGGLQPATLNTIDFITIATAGDATEFGDLPVAIRYGAGLTDSIRGVFTGGGAPGGTSRNSIDFVIIETTGNAQDFGDLFVALHYPSACSDSHGGLS